MATSALQDALLGWFDEHRRDLPWRTTGSEPPDPYAVLVSETMLQQTRVATVAPRFTAWMARFPTVGALATATPDDVMAAWSGLGYYRRAEALHRAAKTIAAGGWPTDAAALAGLPGVGPYTAAAVASIAFGEPTAAVDGNVTRVVSRLFAIEDDVTRAAGKRRVAQAAAGLVDKARPGPWNEAMMELGATVCTPVPTCSGCPARPHCQAHAQGTYAALPLRRAKPPRRRERRSFTLARSGGKVWLVRRPPGLLGGTWALPETPGEAGDLLGVTAHVFTHREWRLEVRSGPARGEGRWVAIEDLRSVGISTAMRNALREAGVPA